MKAASHVLSAAGAALWHRVSKLDWLFATLGYDLTPAQQTSPRLTANETSAVLSEKVGALQAETTRALSDGVFDENEGRRVQEAVAATEAVLRELKAHAKKVQGRK